MEKKKREVNKSTEQAILAAAEAEFMSKGFADARTTSIANAAGVTHSMLHYYFRTKELLFERIVQSKAEEMSGVVLSVLEDDSLSFIDKVIKVLVNHFEFVKKNPLLPSFIMAESNKGNSVLGLLKAGIMSKAYPMASKTMKQLHDEIEAGRICPINITALLTDILSLNVVSVSMSSQLSAVLGMTQDEFLEMRLNENIETIKKRLRP